jgi:hypothetical protein
MGHRLVTAVLTLSLQLGLKPCSHRVATSSDSWETNMGSAWPLHKDDTLFRSGRPTGLNIYALFGEDL